MLQKTSLIDLLISELQHGLKTCHTQPSLGGREYPADTASDNPSLSETERLHIAGLMRVNNAGEVAAQGLYRGQALCAKDAALSESMKTAAEEENEHLSWCQLRLSELGHKRSKLDGIWYWGSFTIGALAGAVGDRWSLGFVKETELQVCKHLDKHLSLLPDEDGRSRAILKAMRQDEMQHAIEAEQAGASNLPAPIKYTMKLVAKVMTISAYRI